MAAQRARPYRRSVGDASCGDEIDIGPEEMEHLGDDRQARDNPGAPGDEHAGGLCLPEHQGAAGDVAGFPLLPQILVARDLDQSRDQPAAGQEARRFGAESSGYVVLYDGHRQLAFHGGITSARGHAGDNAGENVVLTLVAGGQAPLKETPVFGCGLLDNVELTVGRP